MAKPIPYSADVEHIDDDEAKVTEDLVNTLLSISKKTYADGHHGLRSVHAKSHALLTGEIEILDNPPELAQGLFGTPATYDVILRYSTTPGDVLPDSVSTPRGLAIKVLGLGEAGFPGIDGSNAQDFVMVNGPKFQAPNAKVFLANLKLLAPTTDRFEGVKVAASAVLQVAEKAIEAVGGASATVRSLGGEPATHPLGETFFVQLPLRYGDYMARISVVPVAPELTALKGKHLDVGHDPLALRHAMLEHFATQGGIWEVQAQLCTNLDTMPIEKADSLWPVDESPYVTVARITVKPQAAWTEEKSLAIDDGMSFSPWHSLEAHRPLGSVMRVRKAAYEASRRFRSIHNDQPVATPAGVSEIAGIES